MKHGHGGKRDKIFQWIFVLNTFISVLPFVIVFFFQFFVLLYRIDKYTDVPRKEKAKTLSVCHDGKDKQGYAVLLLETRERNENYFASHVTL
jgi:hypothetical protein